VSANGLAGTVATATTTPAITLSTSITGLLYGNGTALAATTVSAPLAYSAGTLSITQAGAASNGYLSSTDWNTFNNKQPAGTYVTSVGATAPITSSGGTTPTIGVTAAALTKTDDTNVTLTLGGAPTTSLLAATSLTLGWTGTLAASRGGTGLSALGTGVATWLGTPSSANLAAAVTDETGSGALVFGTAPTISNLTVTGTSGNVYSSTWTPTLTAVTNVAASTASEGQFMRVGNVVTFSGQVAIDPTIVGNTALRMTLPVASNFASTRQAAGTFAPAAFADENVGAILADTTNDELLLRYVAKVITNTTFQFHGTYIVV
jgi:enamine deaminase RidA (YjgF/YER057c/UK114 family)